MSYQLQNFSYNPKTGQWYIIITHDDCCNLVPKKVELEIVVPDDVKALGKNALVDHDNRMKYSVVNKNMQIDEDGKLFVTDAKSMRFNWVPLVGIRWATQSELDKYCLENPDSWPTWRGSFDWNAAAWKAFLAYQAKSQKA